MSDSEIVTECSVPFRETLKGRSFTVFLELCLIPSSPSVFFFFFFNLFFFHTPWSVLEGFLNKVKEVLRSLMGRNIGVPELSVTAALTTGGIVLWTCWGRCWEDELYLPHAPRSVLSLREARGYGCELSMCQASGGCAKCQACLSWKLSLTSSFPGLLRPAAPKSSAGCGEDVHGAGLDGALR